MGLAYQRFSLAKGDGFIRHGYKSMEWVKRHYQERLALNIERLFLEMEA